MRIAYLLLLLTFFSPLCFAPDFPAELNSLYRFAGEGELTTFLSLSRGELADRTAQSLEALPILHQNMRYAPTLTELRKEIPLKDVIRWASLAEQGYLYHDKKEREFVAGVINYFQNRAGLILKSYEGPISSETAFKILQLIQVRHLSQSETRPLDLAIFYDLTFHLKQSDAIQFLKRYENGEATLPAAPNYIYRNCGKHADGLCPGCRWGYFTFHRSINLKSQGGAGTEYYNFSSILNRDASVRLSTPTEFLDYLDPAQYDFVTPNHRHRIYNAIAVVMSGISTLDSFESLNPTSEDWIRWNDIWNTVGFGTPYPSRPILKPKPTLRTTANWICRWPAILLAAFRK